MEDEKRGKNCIVSGLIGLFGAIMIWRLTNNLWGWLALALPGAILIFWGWFLILRHR